MPRGFTEAEREQVHARLLEAGRASIARVGLRKTTIEAVVRAAGVSKGAFYLFFPSKEALLFAVFGAVEAEVRAEAAAAVGAPGLSPRERIACFLRLQFDALERHPVLMALADPEDAAWLMRAAPPELLAENLADDDRFARSLLDPLVAEGALSEADRDALVAMPRVALAMTQQRALIGDAAFPAVVALLVDALADRVCGAPSAAQAVGRD